MCIVIHAKLDLFANSKNSSTQNIRPEKFPTMKKFYFYSSLFYSFEQLLSRPIPLTGWARLIFLPIQVHPLQRTPITMCTRQQITRRLFYVEREIVLVCFKWQRISSTTLQFNYETAVKVHIDPQGNPVVVGYRHTVSSDGHNARTRWSFWKYDPAGTLQYKAGDSGFFSYFNNSQYWTRSHKPDGCDRNVYIGTAGAVVDILVPDTML